MSDLKYNGSIVNAAVLEMDAVSKKFPTMAAGVKSATAKITGARGFDKYVGGINSSTYSDAINTCSQGVSSMIQTIRQTQVKILEYSQDDEAIQEFLDTLSRVDYSGLDLSGIEKHISFGRKASNVLKGVGSTLFGFGAGIVEGVADFFETGADLVVLGGSAVASIFTSAYDTLKGTDVTGEMWKNTRSFVSDKKVESAFNTFYSNTDFGQSVKNNAYCFDAARGIGKGMGYSGAMVVANAVTGGLVSGLGIGAPGSISALQLATTAGVMGFSSGTEDAWADGATLGKGIGYGVATGAWNSAQWAIGARINQVGGLGDQLARDLFKSATKGAGLRVGLSALDAAAEGVVQPGLSMIYKNYDGANIFEQYGNAFEQAGGVRNVLTQAAVGAASATAGEIFKARSLLKERQRVVDANKIPGTDIEIETPYSKQLEGMSGYETYGASNIPQEYVIDDMAIIAAAGDGDVKAGLSHIAEMSGADSIQAVTAKATVVRDAIQNSGGVSPDAGYETVARHVQQIYGSAGIDGVDVTLAGNGLNPLDACDQYFADDVQKWNEVPKVAMTRYTGTGYNDMNSLARSGITFETNQHDIDCVGALSSQLANDFSGMQNRTILYRGIEDMNWVADGALKDLHGQDLADAINGLGGGVFSVGDNGFGSTTPVLGEGFTSKPWHMDVILVSSVPEGTPGSYVGRFSENSYEAEYLLQAGYGNKQMIYGAELIGNQVFVYTELI